MAETQQLSPEKEHFSFPTFVYKPEVLGTYDDEKLMRRCLGLLKNRGLYSPHLLFAGFSGTPVYKRGGFGDRVDTFAVTEDEWREGVLGYDAVPGNQNPFNHALHRNPKIVGLGVFDSEKLILLEDHPQWAAAVRQGRAHDIEGLPENLDIGYHYVTPDGSSLDSATVAILFYKNPL